MTLKQFYKGQDSNSKAKYRDLLKATGSLSGLYTDNINPFLYYRAMEKIFCKSFDAEDLSRSDVSVDAAKDGVGIGLKTFLHENGNTYQKIAEFNRESYLLNDLSDLELIKKVSVMRNERIRSTKVIYELDTVLYHFITRGKNTMNIYEDRMDDININNLKITKIGKTTIHFTDGINEYNFSKSKSTLLKKFNTDNLVLLEQINIDILKDPFDYILGKLTYDIINESTTQYNIDSSPQLEEHIILPLYSERSGIVEPKSGLNMWNAGGRARHHDEIYIPIPSWIHKKIIGFFKYKDTNNRTDSFKVILPNKKIISMKVTQQGGKALQSDPNKDLGKWILRDILKLEPNHLVTKEDLDKIGIDCVQLTKKDLNNYRLDFLPVGEYEKFKEEIQGK